jgi:hypothetical protein
LPEYGQWYALENILSGGVCDEKRLAYGGSGVDSGAWSCAPAGNGNVATGINGWENDGLRDPVTFDGQAGDGYWTRSSSTTLPAVRTLLYYKLTGSGNNSDKVGRAADYNNNTPECDLAEGNCQEHQVRCRYDPAGGIIGGGDGGGGDGSNAIPRCYGWGCGPGQ